jgi:hypothetical protein
MQTQQVSQQVMKKKKKKKKKQTSLEMLLCDLLFNARCFNPFCLAFEWLIHLIVQGASLLFCLAFESLPIQYKVSLMMIGAKISHGCI